MEPQFWHERWEAGQIGFHKSDANPLLLAHFHRLGLAPGARVFVPLCGKTRDIAWLLGQGMRVVGAELSEIAVRQLFHEMNLAPEVDKVGAIPRYRGAGAEVFAGDIFDLGREEIGPIDAIYDRAALVALPPKMRAAYAKHLVALTGGAKQLAITFEYDQSAMNGPPFSVPPEEVQRHYAGTYAMQVAERGPVTGGLKGVVEAEETVWVMG